jgi:DNA polymerase III subunit beta
VKLKIGAKALADLLGRLNGIPTKSPLAATEHVAITVGTCEDSVTISATDIDTWGRVHLGGVYGEPGTVIVPFAMLRAFAQTQGDRELRLEQTESGRVTVHAGKTRIVLPSLHPEDYPQLPTMEVLKQLPMQRIIDAIKTAKYAASEDDARASLCGIYFKFGSAASSDGHRAVLIEGPTGLPGVLMPVKFANIVERQFSRCEFADYSLTGSMIELSTPEAAFGSRLFAASFPDVKAILPEFQVVTILPRAATIDALKAAGVIAPKNNLIRLDVSGRVVKISAVGESTSFEQELDGGDWEKTGMVHINYRYLLEALQVMSSESIEVSMSGETAPVLLRDGETIHVVMPMRG